MSSICKTAKMSPGHLYHYFKSKNDLIKAIVESDSAYHEEKLASLVESGNTLEAMLSRIDEVWQKDKELDAALYSEIMAEASRSPEVAAVIRQHEIRLRERFAKVIVHGQDQGNIDPEIDAHSFATVIIAAVTGLRIADQAGTLMDRAPATQSLATIVSRTLLPK